MQPTKSKKSALILSTIAVLSFTITSAGIDILIPYLINRDIHTIVENPEVLSRPGDVLALLMILVTLLAILIAIVAFWLYRFFGERHYGRRAALRWALFGFTFAVWLHTLGWIFQDRLAILKGILQFLGVFATYFLTRKLIPFEISDN